MSRWCNCFLCPKNYATLVNLLSRLILIQVVVVVQWKIESPNSLVGGLWGPFGRRIFNSGFNSGFNSLLFELGLIQLQIIYHPQWTLFMVRLSNIYQDINPTCASSHVHIHMLCFTFFLVVRLLISVKDNLKLKRTSWSDSMHLQLWKHSLTQSAFVASANLTGDIQPFLLMLYG